MNERDLTLEPIDHRDQLIRICAYVALLESIAFVAYANLSSVPDLFEASGTRGIVTAVHSWLGANAVPVIWLILTVGLARGRRWAYRQMIAGLVFVNCCVVFVVVLTFDGNVADSFRFIATSAIVLAPYHAAVILYFRRHHTVAGGH